MSDPASTPIVVSANPVTTQIAAGIRQVGAALAIILTAFGATAMAGKIGVVVSLAPQFALILTILGPLVWGGITALGQLVTRAQAKKAVVMANNLPDEIATTK